MILPKSVRDQAKNADDLHKKAYGTEGDDKGTPPKVEDPPAKAPVVADPPKKEPAPEPVVVQPVIPVKGAEDFEQKYKVIQGKYDAEIPALRSQVADLTEQVRKFMENKPNESAKEPENFKEAVKAMEEQYGPEFTGMVNNAAEAKATIIAKEIANQIVDERLKDINAKVETVAEVQVQSASDIFYTAMEKGLGKGWGTGINKDPHFNAWLATPIDAELGGETYKDKLIAAHGSLDNVKALTIFNRYLKLNPQAKDTTASKLEELIIPEDKGGGDDLANLNKEKKIYTQAEISQFYKDVIAGVYKGRPEEQARIDADILAAPAEGRIT